MVAWIFSLRRKLDQPFLIGAQLLAFLFFFLFFFFFVRRSSADLFMSMSAGFRSALLWRRE